MWKSLQTAVRSIQQIFFFLKVWQDELNLTNLASLVEETPYLRKIFASTYKTCKTCKIGLILQDL